MKRMMTGLLCLMLWASQVQSQTPRVFWGSLSGSSGASCSAIMAVTQPGTLGTADRALDCATNAGDTVYLKGGNYQQILDFTVRSTGNGTSYNNPITVRSAPGETVTIRGIQMYLNSAKSYFIFQDMRVDGCCSSDPVIVTHPNHHIRYQRIDLFNATTNGFACRTDPSTDNDGVFPEWIDVIARDGNSSQIGGYGIYNQCDDYLVDGIEVYNWKGSGAIEMHNAYSGLRADRGTMRRFYIHDMHEGTNSHLCEGFGSLDGAGVLIYDGRIDLRTCPTNITSALIRIGGSGSSLVVYNVLGIGGLDGIDYCAFGQTTDITVKNSILLPTGGGPAIHKSPCAGSVVENFSHNACFSSDTSCGSSKVTLTSHTNCVDTNLMPLSTANPCRDAGTYVGLPFNGLRADIGQEGGSDGTPPGTPGSFAVTFLPRLLFPYTVAMRG
jgi:hypothetical protein